MQKALNTIKDSLARKNFENFEIYLKRNKGISLEVKDLQLENLENQIHFGFGIRLLKDNRLGFAFGTDLSQTSLDYLIDQALLSSQVMLCDSNYDWTPVGLNYPSLSNRDSSFEKKSLQEKIALALEMEKTARGYDSKIKNVRYVSYADSLEEICLFNSYGLYLTEKRTGHSLSIMAVSEEKSDSESSCETFFSPFWSDLNPKELALKAAKQAVDLLGGKKIPNYRGSAILYSRIVSDMLGILAPSATAENIHKKNSFLVGKKDKKIYSSEITLMDDGLYPKGEETKPFDDEGIPRQSTSLIEKGVVRQFLYDSYWARHDKTTSTGNATRGSPLHKPHLDISNFYLKPQEASFDDLMRQLDRGLLITEVIGMHTADPISGDFSVGIQGFIIKNGKEKIPFRSVALTGNLHEVFSRVIKVGSDLKFYGSIGAPSLLIDDLSVSGE